MKIITEHWAKPIPQRQFDWEATYSDYDFGDPIGFGATEVDAVLDLICPDILANVRDQVIAICAQASQQQAAR